MDKFFRKSLHILGSRDPTKDTPNQARLVHLLGARSGGLCVGQARSPQGLIWSIGDAKLGCFNERLLKNYAGVVNFKMGSV